MDGNSQRSGTKRQAYEWIRDPERTSVLREKFALDNLPDCPSASLEDVFEIISEMIAEPSA